MIIVEGPDGSGKSTLIAKLGMDRRRFKSLRGGVGGVNAHGLGDGDFGWSGASALASYTSTVCRHLHEALAFDRYHLSEVVYGPLLRGHQELPPEDLERLNFVLHTNQVPVILCLPPLEVTLANVMREGRERPSYQTVEFLTRAYQEFLLLAPWATIVYDYTRDPIPTWTC